MDPIAPGAERAEPPTKLELFLGFLGISAVAFGGVLPWAHYVLVERRRWLTNDEFSDLLALGQVLPGPNIVNVSIGVGARFHGLAGASASFLGLMGLPVAIVLALAELYARFADLPAMQGALSQVAAAACGLLIAMAAKLAVPLLKRRFLLAAPFVAATFVAVALLRWPLLAVLAALAPLSILVSARVK